MPGSLARDSIFSALAGASTTIAGFAGSVIVARLIGLEGTGVVAFASWLLLTTSVVVDLGVPGALARYLPELRERGEESEARRFTASLLIPYASLAFCIAAGFIGYAAWLWRANPASLSISVQTYGSDPLFWALIGVTVCAQAFANFLNGYLRGSQQFQRLAGITFGAALLQITATAVGAVVFGVAGALAAMTVSALVSILFLSRIKLERPGMAPALRRRVSSFALWTYASYLLSTFAWSRMEVFFLERYWGAQEVALFSVSLTLANLATQGPLLLAGALLPRFSQLKGGGTPERMQDAYVASVRIMAFLVFPACFGIAAIMPALLPMLYGQAFAPAINAATILVTASAFGAAATTTVIYLLAMERTGFNVATGIAGAILTVGAGLLIVPIYGAEGAALARAVIQLAIVAAAVWYVTQRLDARVPYAALGRILLAAAGCGAAARLSLYVVSPHGTNGAAALAVAVPVGVFVYVAAIRLLRALPDADLDRIATALSLLPRALRPIAERALGFLRASSATAWGGLQPETIEKRISSHD